MADVDPLLHWRDRRVRETHKESLPAEVRMVIEQLKAQSNDQEARLAKLEGIMSAFVAEAIARIKGAA